MSRPLRIQFPGACYHIMNRGAAHRAIFKSDKHRFIFLALLEEVHEMFRAEIYAYCLMDNHYHLLLSTPDANLSRIMRHLNGVYTQRFNYLENSDGSLFRGRYKAILVDADNYLLTVSRYIHLNPVDAGIVKNVVQYQWSSYPAYIGKKPKPDWLDIRETLAMISQRQQKQRYQIFVEQGIDQNTEKFYKQKKLSPILGSEQFVNKHMNQLEVHREIPASRQKYRALTFDVIVEKCAQQFAAPAETLYEINRGRGQVNTARNAAMYICRKYAGYRLNDIAEHFTLNHYGSVSGAVSRFARLMEENDSIKKKMMNVVKTINKQT